VSFCFIDNVALLLVAGGPLTRRYQFTGIYIEPRSVLQVQQNERSDAERMAVVERRALAEVLAITPGKHTATVGNCALQRLAVIDANLRWAFVARVDVQDVIEWCIIERPDAEWNF
jgi:hypothetical protein